MTNERIIQIDSVDAYNKLYGWETLHPLVTVVRSALPLRLSKNHANPMASNLNHSRLRSTLVALLAKNYGLYALFLKQGDGCSIRYGREKYDYQEGPQWWTDSYVPDDYWHNCAGARYQYIVREDIMRDWAERWSWLKE